MRAVLRRIERAMENLLARAVVTGLNTASKCQMLQVELMPGEPKGNVEHLEPYGFTSAPKNGAEGFALFPDGDRSHGVILMVSDRRYRIKGLKVGEVALYDDQGQSFIITRDGIVVDCAGKIITFKNGPKARFEMPIESTGDIHDNCDDSGKTMAQMRVTYNGHTHSEHGDGGGTTGNPNQPMGSP